MNTETIFLFGLTAALGLSCLALAVVLLVKRRRMQALATKIEDFLSCGGAALDFSVREDDLSALQNAAAELQHRLLLAREHEKQEGARAEALTADISHQLKTPLSSLRLFAEMDAGAHMEAQLSQIERMEKLIYSLLRLEKLCADGYEFTFDQADVGGIVHDAWSGLAGLYPACRLSVTGAASVRCDRKWLTEVYVNLLKNACEHMPRGGGIAVTLEPTETSFYCVVEDEGGGVPDKELRRLFERFYRASAQADERRGCGLGLAIVKEIILRHHGDVRAENGPRGLCICFSLPIYHLNRS